MTDSFVTQCPHCHTSFRVSRAQLGAAHGAVRCGACMQVFNATQHLVGAPPQAAPVKPAAPQVSPPRPAPATAPAPSQPASVAAPAASTAPTKAPATPGKPLPDDTLWIHDDLDLDALNLDEELARLEEEEQQLSRDFLAAERAPKPGDPAFGEKRKARDPHDESWAEQLLADKPAPARPIVAPAQPAAPMTESPRIEPAIGAIAPHDEIEPPPQSSSDGDDDGLHPDFRSHEGDRSLRLSADEPIGAPDSTAEIAESDEPSPEPGLSALPARATIEEIELKAAPGALRSEPSLRHGTLLELDEEPLQLDWRQQKKPWGRWIGWSLLNLLAAGALAGQYVNHHFEELARQDQYRPWFEQLCPEIGCQLPSKVDVAQIKSSNLVVRSHPEFNGALVVDAILYNRATFAQPFPLLELRFADMGGQLLASRRFKPSEYLGGELAGQAEMPPQTPIHVSLDILDPGPKAVNYSLSFFSPE